MDDIPSMYRDSHSYWFSCSRKVSQVCNLWLLRVTLFGVGVVILLCSIIVLACIKQDDTRHTFGHSGGFACPFVPFLPAACILINTYLLIDLGVATWLRVSVWLLIGLLIYLFYGRTHSSLLNAIYVPSARADEIHRTHANHLA
ncbi:cationic amino acid transporter 4 vacuolar-like [Trifolium medium]|uniref:Cationic amino acid transporter 4 vacuolar-like n=1 Tax=Trifolium medium TaxID=97028 RepID=A0A392MIQ7_9FABA|nr:cationic amino acid transporter 4 vacuolar-like [Trifolium medium]